MFPNLYYLIDYLFGFKIEFLQIIQTFGFFVAVAFVAGYWAFVKEYNRKLKAGILNPIFKTITIGKKITSTELVGNGFFGFVLGYKCRFSFT